MANIDIILRNMKYLRYYLIRAGLCLLLVCSANVASAQMDGNDEPLVASLEMVSISTNTSVGLATIDFKVNLTRLLTDGEFLIYPIVFLGVPSDGGELMDPPNHEARCGVLRPLGESSRDGTLLYFICIDGGEQNVRLRLTLDNSFDRRKTITITLLGNFDRTLTNVLEGVQRDPSNFALSYPGTAIFLRSKVFLEGPLQ